MALSDIADGVECVQRQRADGVPEVDATDDDLAERLSAVGERLPCSAGEAATVIERRRDGAPVDEAARAAGVAPTVARITLYRAGLDAWDAAIGDARAAARAVIEGELSLDEAQGQVGERAFALGAYVETHDPLPAAVAAVEGAAAADGPDDPLAETRSDLGDLL